MGELPEPVAGPHEVIIRVRACGVNYPDTLIIEDRYQYRPQRPFAPGAEIAGSIEEIGSEVTGLRVGQNMLAMVNWGGFAERVSVPASRCIPMPEAMPFVDGAAFIMTYGTAYHALHQRGRIKPGETLLVLGAAGGVGLAAVQLGKAAGARVIAGISSEERRDLVLAHGAANAFVYPATADARTLAALFKEQCGKAGADLVIDPVGGPLSEAAARALAWDGRLLIVGFPAGITHLPLNLLLLKGGAAIGVFYGQFIENEAERSAANDRALLDLYQSGAIRPHVARTYSLSEGGQAIAALAERRVAGKVVVEIMD